MPPVGLKIYEKAAANGKRCQALCQAKNHALVMEDCALERTVAGVINSAFGCAGQRCMALSCCVVQDNIADAFVAELKKQAEKVNCGPPGTRAPAWVPSLTKSIIKRYWPILTRA